MNNNILDSDLKEGKKYKLIIEKKIVLPDNKSFYIVIDPNNKKHLLPAEYYSNYNLENKKEIICKIDKINCNGRIFFEPEHPYFITGHSYNFTITDFGIIKNKKGNKLIQLIVKDDKKMSYTAITEKQIEKTAQKIRAKIKKISKGRLYLEM